MIRKTVTGEYQLMSRDPRDMDPKTGRPRVIGTFKTLEAAKNHERAVQFFKRHG